MKLILGWLIIVGVSIVYCLYFRHVYVEDKLKKSNDDMKFEIKMLEIQRDLRDIEIGCLERQLKYQEWENEK